MPDGIVEILAPVNATGVGMHVQYLAGELAIMEHQGITGHLKPLVFPTSDGGAGGINRAMLGLLASVTKPERRIPDPSISVVINVPGKAREMWHRCRAKKTAIYTVFEIDDPKFLYLKDLELYDEVWVPSVWAKHVLLDCRSKGLLKKSLGVHVVPEGTSTHEAVYPVCENPMGIVSVGKFEKRKGQDVLLEALDCITGIPLKVDAFWQNPWDPEAPERYLKSRGWISRGYKNCIQLWYKNSHVISKHPRYETDKEWQAVAVNCALAVFPHRGEGWGIPILDCIGLGIPTRATVCTGPADYLDEYYTAQQQPPEVEYVPIEDPVFFKGAQGQWPQMDPQALADDIVAHIKKPFETRTSLRTISRRVADRFSWRNSAWKFWETCEALVGK